MGILSREGPSALAVIMRREARSRGKSQSRRSALQGGYRGREEMNATQHPASLLIQRATGAAGLEHGAIPAASREQQAPQLDCAARTAPPRGGRTLLPCFLRYTVTPRPAPSPLSSSSIDRRDRRPLSFR